MDKDNRTHKSIRNSIYALTGQFIAIILNFISRTIFIHTLGAVYLGVNGLFTNVLSVLSFAELGFSTAIIYEMYKPLANADYRTVAGLMNFYKKIYRYVGLSIFFIGILLIPYLDFLIKDASVIPSDIPPLWFIYLLFLGNTSISYFYNYKRSIVVASQNGYIDSLNQLQFNIGKNFFQIIILILWNDFIWFLVAQLLCTLLGNIAISRKADKLFPYLNEYKNAYVNKSILYSIKKNVTAQVFNKLGGVIVGGVDNLLIAKFVGVITVGYYSNYLLIIMTLKTLFIQMFTPISASVGNFVATKSNEDAFSLFKKLLFINSYFAISLSVCLAILTNSFIAIFWGEEYVFDISLTLVITLNFYMDRIRLTSQIFIDVRGLFWQIKWRAIFEAIINIILSLLFLMKFGMGLKGVLLATLLCNVFINFWWEAYVVFQYIFKRSVIKFLIWHIKYLLSMILIYFSINWVIQYISDSYMGFIIKVLISLVMSNSLLCLFYCKTEEFEYLKNMIIQQFIKRK